MKRTPKRRGFTLIELLVVIAIMGVLAGLLVAATIRSKRAAQLRMAWAQLETLAVACENYQAWYGALPPLDADDTENFEVYRALTWPGARGRSLVGWSEKNLNDKGSMVDPWRTTYRFKVTSVPGGRDRLRVHSCGPDRVDDGGAGDDLPPTLVTSE